MKKKPPCDYLEGGCQSPRRVKSKKQPTTEVLLLGLQSLKGLIQTDLTLRHSRKFFLKVETWTTVACCALHVSVFLLSCVACGVGVFRPWWSLWGTPLEFHTQMELPKQSLLNLVLLSRLQKGGGHFPSSFTYLKKPRLFSHSPERWAQNPLPEAFWFISFQPWTLRNPGTPVFGCSWKNFIFLTTWFS